MVNSVMNDGRSIYLSMSGENMSYQILNDEQICGILGDGWWKYMKYQVMCDENMIYQAISGERSMY